MHDIGMAEMDMNSRFATAENPHSFILSSLSPPGIVDIPFRPILCVREYVRFVGWRESQPASTMADGACCLCSGPRNI